MFWNFRDSYSKYLNMAVHFYHNSVLLIIFSISIKVILSSASLFGGEIVPLSECSACRIDENESNRTVPIDVKAENISDLIRESGIYLAYHMNKQHWISVDLREMNTKKIKILLDMSFNLTMQRKDKVRLNSH